ALALSTLAPPSGAVEGRNTGRLQLARLDDANGFRRLSDYEAVVSWGDGTTDTLTAANGGIVNILAGAYLMGAHTYDEELKNGTFSITVTDVGGARVSQSGTVNVADAPLTVTAVNPPNNPIAGVPTGPLTLATWTDADPNGAAGDYTVQVTW